MANAMARQRPGAEQGSPRSRLSRLVVMGSFLLGLFILAFAVSLLINSQAIVGNTHQRNWRSLEVIANNIESWPRTAAEIANARGIASGTKLPVEHPDLGEILVQGADDCSASDEKPRVVRLFPLGPRPSEGPLFEVTGKISSQSSGSATCFVAQAPLKAVVGLDRVNSDFSNLLLVAPDSNVVEQFGSATLPVYKLPELHPIGFAQSLVSGLLKSEESADNAAATLNSGPGASRVRIADTSYYAYVRPTEVENRTSDPCPGGRPVTERAATSASAQPPSPSPTAGGTRQDPPTNARSTSVSGGQGDTRCALYLVALMPTDSLRSAWLSPPPLVLTAFSLGVLIAIALLPLSRLLLIGGAESVSPFELAAIVFGSFAATALITLAFLYSLETAIERSMAAKEAARTATSLASKVQQELSKFREVARRCEEHSQGTLADPNLDAASLPRIVEAGFIDQDGKNPRPACRTLSLPTNTDISARPYFLAFRRAVADGGVATKSDREKSAFAEIRAQSDGVKKTVLIMTHARASASVNSGKAPRGAQHHEVSDGYFLASTFLRTLVHPLLPPPQRFMIVDAAEDRLPVLFHSDAGRAGLENLADSVQHPSEIIQGLRRLKSGKTAIFSRRYDGRISTVAAARVPGTQWIVLVFHAADSVDAIAAGTAGRALAGWAGVTLPAMAIGAWLLFRRRDAWRFLWPSPQSEAVYRSEGPMVAILALIVILAAILHDLPPVIAICTSAFACLVEFISLRERSRSGLRLSLKTERAYRRYVLCMLACVAVAPMVAFWSDSRTLSRELVDYRRMDAAVASLGERADKIAGLQNVIRSRLRAEGPPRGTIEQMRPVSDILENWPDKQGKIETMTESAQRTLAGRAYEWQTGFNLSSIRRCTRPRNDAAGAASATDAAWYCWQQDLGRPLQERIGIFDRRLEPPSMATAVMVVVVGIAGLALVYAMVFHGLWALTGFGIPLDAVKWPTLVLGGAPASRARNQLNLANKSLLVAPQQAVRDAVSDPCIAVTVDLAAELLPAPDESLTPVAPQTFPSAPKLWPQLAGNRPPRLVVSGLELVLRDAKRRRAALIYLERAVDALKSGSLNPLSGIVVIAEMSPLERILDAFEAHSENDDIRDTSREELRWAKLFQDFTTFSFAPIDKLDLEQVNRSVQLSEASRALAKELRWLPGNVIDGVIADHSSRQVLTTANHSYPIAPSRYQEHYTRLIVEWAHAVNPVTDAAAIDFLRANLIEHYEQCWAASSLAERFILDAIAKSCFVNMRKAVALQSLVRRGLVILDPAPRLMNRSFALFIRQTERPDNLEALRSAQPPSAWSSIRLPVTVAVPLLVLALAMAAAESGQELTAIISLLATGTPALLGTLLRPRPSA